MSILDRIFLAGKIIIRLTLFLSIVLLAVSLVLRVFIELKNLKTDESFYGVFINATLSFSFWVSIFAMVFFLLQWLLMFGELIKKTELRREVRMLSITVVLTAVLWVTLTKLV